VRPRKPLDLASDQEMVELKTGVGHVCLVDVRKSCDLVVEFV
jgi:hypothetical protein